MRRRNIKNAKEKVEAYNCMINPEEIIDLDEIFNTNPIYLEIGMGKGNFIIEMAKQNPKLNFIGIEKYEGVILQALKKQDKEQLHNLLIICADCENIPKFFKPKTIDKIFLNFSDPWPKARHEKRRLTSPKYLKIYEDLLKSFDLEFKTDNIGLFEYSLMNFNNLGYHIEELHLDLHKEKENIIETEYESKFKDEKPIYFVRVTK